MEKLNRGKYLILLLMMCIISCKQKQKIDKELQLDYKKFKNYQAIYDSSNAYLYKMIDDSLCYVEHYMYNSWLLDSLLVFSEDSTIFISFLGKQGSEYATLDYVKIVAGYEIDNRWYVSIGNESTVLPRDFYTDRIYEPMNLDNISILGRELYTKKYIKNPSEEIDKYVSKRFGWAEEVTRALVDSVLLESHKNAQDCKYDVVERLRQKKSFIEFQSNRKKQEPSFTIFPKRFD